MSLPASYFDAMYESSDDPWQLADRWYERRKYTVTMASLPRPRYRRAFEPGCSVGVLTDALAGRCDSVVAADVNAAAVATARRRVAHRDNVDVRELILPTQWPAGTFDLIVISEIGYYFDRQTLRQIIDRCVETLDPDGVLVAVHWRHPVQDYLLSGDEVHEIVADHDSLECLVSHLEADFRLDVLVPAPARSVAAVEGLVSR